MNSRRLLSGAIAAILLSILGSAPVLAEDFPRKRIRIVVPATAGGGLDLTARLVADKMAERLGQPVIVDNRAGADTMLGTRLVKESAPDGYTLVCQANGFNITPFLRDDVGFDPAKDFVGIGLISRSPLLVEVGADKPDHSIADFIARAKANPGKLTYGHGGVGTAPQMALAIFLKKAGIDVTQVPYKGLGAAVIDVAGGRVDMVADPYISSAPFIKGAKLRPLAVTASSRMLPLPDVPTFKELGFDYSYAIWNGLLAPAGTPQEVVDKLSDALRYATSSPEIHDRLIAEGTDPSFVTPTEFKRFLADENAEMGKTVKDLNMVRQ